MYATSWMNQQASKNDVEQASRQLDRRVFPILPTKLRGPTDQTDPDQGKSTTSKDELARRTWPHVTVGTNDN
jgi:hypothetical protein